MEIKSLHIVIDKTYHTLGLDIQREIVMLSHPKPNSHALEIQT